MFRTLYVDSPAATGNCLMVVQLDLRKQGPEQATWYDIWAAANAVSQMCVVQGRAGQAINIGMSARLLLPFCHLQCLFRANSAFRVSR